MSMRQRTIRRRDYSRVERMKRRGNAPERGGKEKWRRVVEGQKGENFFAKSSQYEGLDFGKPKNQRGVLIRM